MEKNEKRSGERGVDEEEYYRGEKMRKGKGRVG